MAEVNKREIKNFKNVFVANIDNILFYKGYSNDINFSCSPSLIQERLDFYLSLKENGEGLIILPLEYKSIETYLNETKNYVGMYCYVTNAEITEIDNKKKLKVSMSCEHFCLLENIKINRSAKVKQIEADIAKVIESPVFTEEYREIREKITALCQKYSDIDRTCDMYFISDLNSAVDIDRFIASIIYNLRFDYHQKKTIMEELDYMKKLEYVSNEAEIMALYAEGEKSNDIIFEYKQKLKVIDMPMEVRKACIKEIGRLKYVTKSTAEYGNIIDWLDNVLELPWNKSTEDVTDIDKVVEDLNKTHFGMEKVKQKIIDFAYINMLTKKNTAQTLCLCGPAGTGKSTIAKSIAKALNKKFYQISLAGMSNPDDLCGLKKYFIGAKPGRIVEALSACQSNNCIILLDEIDKIGESTRGNPGSVLLDILDRNQNVDFKDRYLDIPFDLSNVLFIATANDLSRVSLPLRNRMDIINVDGYALDEKLSIVKQYVLPKTLEKMGFDKDLISFSDETLLQTIHKYTNESGLRELERTIETICKKYIIGSHQKSKEVKKTTLSFEQVEEMLQNEELRSLKPQAAKEGEIGVSNILAVYGGSGHVTRLEVSKVKGKGNVILSDNLTGTAKSIFEPIFGMLKTRCKQWGYDMSVFNENDFYIHEPVISIKVDGPSGAVSSAMALLSTILEKPVNHKYAFTGEIALMGRVLPVGGIKEKILACQRNGMEKVFLPEDNRDDVAKIDSKLIKDLDIVFVTEIDEVFDAVFGENK